MKKLISIFLLSVLFSGMAMAQDGYKPQSQAEKDRYFSLSPEEREILNRGEINDSTYAIGGIVGTLFGLGLGQAVQGPLWH